jgi:hypothetical protein
MSSIGGKADQANKLKISEQAILTVGNTGVTKTCVVRRGALQRDEAREDQTARVRKLFKVKSVA